MEVGSELIIAASLESDHDPSHAHAIIPSCTGPPAVTYLVTFVTTITLSYVQAIDVDAMPL